MNTMLELLRETQSIWDRLRQQDKPVVLYGMGHGADKILAACDSYGVPVRGVFASSGFLRDHRYRDFPVRSLDELEQELGEMVVLLSFATRLPAVLEQIGQIAARHELLAPDLPVAGDGLFTPGYLREHGEAAREAYDLLADDLSRRVFLDVIDYKISGKTAYLKGCESSREQAYQELLRPGPYEVFVDAGAYDGDTVEEFLTHTAGRYREIIALEPDYRNFRKLQAFARELGLGNIRLVQAGAWSGEGALPFDHRTGRQAALADGGKPTPVTSVDRLLGGKPATLLKFDVEGAEGEALRGARETIARYHPRMIVSAYHRNDDLFTLPLLIRELWEGYAIYLRHHPYLPAWDTNLYVVPREEMRL